MRDFHRFLGCICILTMLATAAAAQDLPASGRWVAAARDGRSPAVAKASGSDAASSAWREAASGNGSNGIVRTSGSVVSSSSTAPRTGSRPRSDVLSGAGSAARGAISSRVVKVEVEPTVLRPGEQLVSEEMVPPMQPGANWAPGGGPQDYSGPDWFEDDGSSFGPPMESYGEAYYPAPGYPGSGRPGPGYSGPAFGLGCGDSCSGCGSCGGALSNGGADPWYQPEEWGVYGPGRHRLFCFDCLRNCRICPGWHWAQDLQFMIGPDSFQGPLDMGANGNFGYGAGVNYAIPLWHRSGIGGQIGAQWIGSNFTGALDNTTSGVGADRNQVFVTVGIFRRLWHDTCGWQWGVAFDTLADDYYQNTNFTQVRTELSQRFGRHEIGYWGAYGSKNDTLMNAQTFTEVTSNVIGQSNVFWRYHFSPESEGRLWVGGTSTGDVTTGGDLRTALSDYSQFQAYYNYLAPTQGEGDENVQTESWNVGFRLILYPASTARPGMRSRYRPLFDVANNGSFFVNR